MNNLQSFPVPAIITAEENLIFTSNPLIEAYTIESNMEEMRTKQYIDP